MSAYEKTNYRGVSKYTKTGTYYINYKDLSGVSRRKVAKGATTAKEAYRVLNEIKHEISDMRDGLVAKPIDKSVACTNMDLLAKRFFDLRDTKGNEADRGRYTKWVSKRMGTLKHPISQIELESYRKWLRGQSVKRGDVEIPIAPKTVNIIMGLVKSIISWGVKADVVRYPNGVPSVTRLKVDNDRQRVLSTSEIELLLAELDVTTCPRHKRDIVRRNRLVVLLGLYTGARPTSYLGLRVKDVVCDDSGVPLRVKFSAKKGASSYEVPVADKLRGILGGALFNSDGTAKKADELVVTSSYSAIQQSLGAVFDRLFNSGLKGYDQKNKVSLYTLRHSSASLMLEATGDIYRVSKLLGHSSVVTTQRYAKITDKSLEEGINSF